jgi:hypothetical protein
MRSSHTAKRRGRSESGDLRLSTSCSGLLACRVIRARDWKDAEQPHREAMGPERKRRPSALNILFRASGPPSSADGGVRAAFSSHLVGADYGKPSVCLQSPVFCGLPQKMRPNKKKTLSVNGKDATLLVLFWSLSYTVGAQGDGAISLKNEDTRRFAHEPGGANSYDPGETRKLNIFFSKDSGVSDKEPSSGGKRDVPGAKVAVDKAGESEWLSAGSQKKHKNKTAYADRVNLDQFLAQPEFRIKNRWQVLRSVLSFYNSPPDKACKFFVMKRLTEIYGALEQLVTTVRIVFPRNDQGRSEWLRVHSPFSYNVMNVIRHWNISRIAVLIGRLQSRPREVYISELKILMQLIYRPIVILEAVDAEEHIPIIVNKLSWFIYAGDDSASFNAKEKKMLQDLTRLYSAVTYGVHFALHPLLMKLLCNKRCNYDDFFIEYRRLIYDFLNVKKEDCVIPPKQAELAFADEEIPDADTAGQNEQEQRLENAMKSGLKTLDILFPDAGWSRPQFFPDFYQYFAFVFNLEKNVRRLHPENPVLQILILSYTLQNVLAGLRHTIFIEPASNAGYPSIENLIHGWLEAVEQLLYRDYFKLFAEYFDYFSISSRFRKKIYEKRVASELNYFTKSFMLPFFDCRVMPKDIHFSVNEEDNLFGKISVLYEKLDEIVCAPDKTAFIENLQEPFVFDVPTPVSKRLGLLFDKEHGTNEILITIAHEITAILNYLMNNPDSWAYTSDRHKKTFRSKDSAGFVPIEWLEQGLDPDNIFRDSIETLSQKAMQKFNIETKTPD